MMNQDQYHASLLNKGKVGLGWDGITKGSQPKALPVEPPNATDPKVALAKVKDDDLKTIELCFNMRQKLEAMGELDRKFLCLDNPLYPYTAVLLVTQQLATNKQQLAHP